MTKRPLSRAPQVVRKADAETWMTTRPGERSFVRVPAAETGGAYSVVEIVSSPGDCTHWHVHQNEDEYFLVLEGTARVAFGSQVVDATAGMTVTLPRNIPHAWGNPGGVPLRILAMVMPGGVEDALRVIARGDPIDGSALEAQFGVRLVGPPLFPEPRHPDTAGVPAS